MKTAAEMYDFSRKNGYGRGMTKGWSLKHFGLIEEALRSDEDVIFAFVGLHNYKSMSKHDNNFAYAVTNRRIIMAQKRFVGKAFQSVAIDRVNDITLTTGLITGIVTFDAMTEVFNVGVDKAIAENISARIHDLIFDLKEAQRTPIVAATSAADELMKFKQLLDSGVISPEEFNMKKRQILGV